MSLLTFFFPQPTVRLEGIGVPVSEAKFVCPFNSSGLELIIFHISAILLGDGSGFMLANVRERLTQPVPFRVQVGGSFILLC